MRGRLVLPLAAAVVQFSAAALTLGRPQLGLALAFAGGSLPTRAETLAALQLLIWVLVAGTVVWGLAAVASEAASAAAVLRRRLWEISVAAAGVLLLAVGIAHHASSGVALAGGSVQEAQQALGR